MKARCPKQVNVVLAVILLGGIAWMSQTMSSIYTINISLQKAEQLFGNSNESNANETTLAPVNQTEDTKDPEKDWRYFPRMPSQITRNVKELIQWGKSTTLITPEVCKDSKKGSDVPNILIIVLSAVQNFVERNAIRNSWAKDQTTLGDGISASVVFFVGKPANHTDLLGAELKQEANAFKDIVQEDFMDTYYNLTVKSLMLMKWAGEKCFKFKQAQNSYHFVLKVDDDNYVNIPNLARTAYEQQIKNQDNLLMGHLYCRSQIYRHDSHKWYVPKTIFSEPHWPNFLGGPAYLMHRNVMLKLFSTALDLPIVHLEDVFITGIVARKAGIRRENNPAMSAQPRHFVPCIFQQAISTHKVPPQEMLKMKEDLIGLTGCKNLTENELRHDIHRHCTWEDES